MLAPGVLEVVATRARAGVLNPMAVTTSLSRLVTNPPPSVATRIVIAVPTTLIVSGWLRMPPAAGMFTEMELPPAPAACATNVRDI